jgi:clorobiocin biosynthesis protein CloN6
MTEKKKRRAAAPKKTALPPIPRRELGGPPVLYIHPAKQGVKFFPDDRMGRPYGIFPLGLPALVNVLRSNGIRVKGINQALEMQLNNAFNLKSWLSLQRGVKVVLIDMHWYEHTYGAIQTAQIVKEILPMARTVLGGLTATGFARDILQAHPEVDFIIRGDAEQPLLALVQLILQAGSVDLQPDLPAVPNLSYRSGGAVCENALGYCASTSDLDRLDFVSLDFLEHHQEYLVFEYIVTDLAATRQAMQQRPYRGRWLCTARGCKYECSYCGGCKSAHRTLAGRNGIVTRSPEKVVDDLARLKQPGVIQASLSYDIAELGEDYWRAFFAEIKRRDIKIGLYNEFFQLPDPRFVDAFFEVVDKSHSCLALSPLVGNERVRRLNGKHFSNQQLFDLLDLLSQHQSYVFIYFSLNLPGETETTFNETLDLAQAVYDFYPHSRLKILNTVHTIDPLAPMNVHAAKFGVESSMSSFKDFYEYCASTQIASSAARTGLHRGFDLAQPAVRSLEKMADAWDRARLGKEDCWWPVPPSW